MRIPQPIDRILELGEAIFRYYFREYNRRAREGGTTDRSPTHPLIPPPPEEAQLKAHLLSLDAAYLYGAVVALEIGRGLLHPDSFMPALLAVSGAFPMHIQIVERLLKDPMHLANYLEGGLLRLHESGVNLSRLFNSRTASTERPATSRKPDYWNERN